MKKRIYNNPILHVFVILIVCLLAYFNTFDVPFQFDDNSNIVRNPLIRDLNYFIHPSETEAFSRHNIYWSFKQRYVGYLTFALNYSLHGLDVKGYHIVNILIHTINSILIYCLVILTFKTPFFDKSSLKNYSKSLALCSALLFVSHPVQTQAVTYIIQRLTSLATMFYLLTILCYVTARLLHTDSEAIQPEKGQRFSLILYLISICSAILGMKTKEMVITLPLIILLYELMFLKGKLIKRALLLLPILLTILIIPLSMIELNQPIGELLSDVSDISRLQTELSRVDYLFTESRVITTYIRLLFMPINQTLEYDFPIYHSFFNPAVFLSFIFLLSIFSAGVYLLLRYKNESSHARLISFGIFWFFITLSVESSIIPIIDVIFEHRVYLPSIGFFIAISTVIFWILSRMKVKHRLIIHSALILIIVALAIMTHNRNLVWKDNFSLWQDVIRKSPEHARAANNLALAYVEERGDNQKALELYSRAIALDSEYDFAYFNRGNLYEKTGRYNEAMEDYTRAISLNPDAAYYYHNRGGVYFKQGQFKRAIDDFTNEVSINPISAMGYSDRGYVYLMMDKYDSAISDLTKAITLDNSMARSFMRRGIAYSSLGNMKRAIPDLKKACEKGNTFSCGFLKR